jgi:hypothetical protein
VDAKNFCIGELEVVVLNKLTAMSTAAADVNVVVFAHMENAAFAVPRRSSTLPNYKTNAVAALQARVTRETQDTKPQTQTPTTDTHETERDSTKELSNLLHPMGIAQIGGEVARSMTETEGATELDVLPAAVCQGEVHTSFRQALKRYNLIGYIKSTAIPQDDDSPGASGTWWVIRPWAATDNLIIDKEWELNTTDATNVGSRTHELYSALYGNYAFYRGGMRFRIVMDDLQPIGYGGVAFSVFITYPTAKKPSLDPTWTRPEEYMGNYSTTAYGVPFTAHPALSRLFDVNSDGGSEPLVPVSVAIDREDRGWESLQFFGIQGGIEFEVPYYSTGHMSTAGYYSYDDGKFWQAQRDGQAPMPIIIIGVNHLPPNSALRVYRAVADDFSFAGLVGVPRSTVMLEKGPATPATALSGASTSYVV